MSEPIPPVEHAADAMKAADEAIAALKRTKPNNAAQARVRSAELMTLQQTLLEASRKVVAANAAKRVSNGGNGVQPVAGEATSLSGEVVTALARGLVPFLREQILEAVTPLVARNAVCEHRIVELEAHVIELEQRPTMRYLGVFIETQLYAIGDFVTDNGSLWACSKACTGVRPGDGACWVLAVKRGRDGKGR